MGERMDAQERAYFLPLLTRIDDLLQQKACVTLAIDGPCCSGKSTLALRLQEWYGGAVIPMDAFFLPPPMRTSERLMEPGGNIHYERFLEEAAAGIKKHTGFSYHPFHCGTRQLQGAVHIPKAPLRIMEGSYSMHPKFAGLYDFSVFLEIRKAHQAERLRKRETPQQAERFFKEWMPMENQYFQAYEISKQADFLFSAAIMERRIALDEK